MENPFKKIPLDSKTMVLMGLVIVIITYVDWTFILHPQLQKTAKLNAKIKNIRTDLDRLRKDLSELDSLTAKAKTTSTGSSFKTKELISSGNLPLLLKEIADLAKKNEVKIMQIKPTWETKDTKSPASTTPPKNQALTASLISLEISSDYHHLGGFINDLENHKIFLVVEELKIAANANNFLKQDVKLVLKTNVKK